MKRQNLSFLSLLVVLVACQVRAEVLEKVVAKVNGDIITLSDFEARQVMAIQSARVPTDKIEEYLRANNAKILESAVDDLLIAQRAEDLEIHLPPEAVKAAIENIKKDNHIESDDELRAQLRKEGMTYDDLRRNITETYLKRAVLQRELQRKVAPTEDDIVTYYNAHKDEYATAATAHLLQIFIPADDPDAGAVASEGPNARAKARQVVVRARAGEDFEALATTYSAANSDLGEVKLKELSSAMQKAIAPLQVGEVSEPVSGSDGYRIFKLVSRTDASVTPLDQVRDAIRNTLMEEKGNDAYDTYVAELRKNAIIDVRVREVPLQVSRPVAPSTLLEPPPEDTSVSPPPTSAPASPAAGPAEPAPSAEDEFQTTPQDAPEHVTHAPAPPPDAQDEPKKDAPAQP